MTTNELLDTNREASKKLILEQLNQTEDVLTKEVDQIKEWLKIQQDLPEIPQDIIIENFLFINKFNVNKVKEKLKMYYHIRWEIPELYINKNPKYGNMKIIADTICWVPLPEITPQASRILMLKILNNDSSRFNIYDFLAHTYNITEVRIREECTHSDIFVYDLEGVTFSHYLKISPEALRKGSIILEKVFSSRVAGIHYLNLPTSLEVLIKIVKMMLKEKLRKRICIHKSIDTLYNHVPRESLPEEYGGNAPPLPVLHKLWMKKMEDYQDVFDHLEQIAIDGKPNKPVDTQGKVPIRQLSQLSID